MLEDKNGGGLGMRLVSPIMKLQISHISQRHFVTSMCNTKNVCCTYAGLM